MAELRKNEDEEDGEEDWNDTRWAVPAEGPVLQLPAATTFPCTTAIGQEARGHEDGAKQTGQELMSRMEINDHKAGMEGLNREHVNQIILEASKGSRFFENEKKKEEQVNRRIADQKNKLTRITSSQIQQGIAEADKLLLELQAQRDLSRSIVHVDMDAFYAAVEERDDPSLKDKPMAVGSLYMLSTSNYNARKFGVRAGMPGFIGKKLCSDLIMVPLNFDKYTAVSQEVKAVMSCYDPHLCPMSLDEAYLDFTDHMKLRKDSPVSSRTFYYRPSGDVCCCLVERLSSVDRHLCLSSSSTDKFLVIEEEENMCTKLHDDLENQDVKVDGTLEKQCNEDCNKVECGSNAPPKQCPVCAKSMPDVSTMKTKIFGTTLEEAVNEMRFRIHQKTQLTASAGIAANRMLAKICSDKNKPNGQFLVPSTVKAITEFITDLPIRKVSGIGKVSEKMLSALDVHKCSDLLVKRGILYYLYSPVSFNYFMRIALGIGSTRVAIDENSKRKSMSTEQTFGEINKPAELFAKCLELCESLSEDLKKENIMGKTVTLKLKMVNFEVKTKAQSVHSLTNEVEAIYAAARDLLRTEIQACAPQPLKLRLMGVRMSNLVEADEAEEQKQGTITDILRKLQNKPPQTVGKTEYDARASTNATSADCDKTLKSEITEMLPAASQHSSILTFVMPIPKQSEKSTSNRNADFKISTCVKTDMDDDNKQTNLHSKYSEVTLKVATAEKAVTSNGPGITKEAETTLLMPENRNLSVLPDDVVEHSNVTVNTETVAGLIPEKYQNYVCPVCGKPLHGYSVNKISLHVDECLSNTQAVSCNEGNTPQPARRMQEDIENNGNKIPGENCPYTDNDGNEVPERENCTNPEISQATFAGISSARSQPASGRSYTNSSARLPDCSPGQTKPFQSTASGDSFVCPVCEVKQSTADLNTFNAHVDICLNSRSQGAEAMYEESPKRENVPRFSLVGTSSTLESVKSKGTSKLTSQSDLKTCTTPRKELGLKAAAVSSEPQLICPVCDLEQDTLDLVAFNAHVDSCLSKATIRQIVRQQDSELPLKRACSTWSPNGPPKKKAKVKTIDSFFKK